MTPLLELRHQFVGTLLFGLGNRVPNTQACISVKGYTALEGTALVGFGRGRFAPLLPT